MTFRDRLIATIRAARPALESPGVIVVGSEVPNLLEDGAAATLVVSQDLDLGALSLVSRGAEVEIGGTRLALPRPAGLLLEKLVTDRTGEKGERDLLVALGVLATSIAEDLDELARLYQGLRPELRHAVRSNLTILSLLAPRSGMPDPRPRRAEVATLLRRLESGDPEVP